MEKLLVRSLHEKVLEQLTGSLKVHSVFAQGFNIQGKDRLIFVSAEGSEEQPLGLTLSKEDLGSLEVEQGQGLVYRDLLLRIGSSYLDFFQARVYRAVADFDLTGLEASFIEEVLDYIKASRTPGGLDVTTTGFLASPLGRTLASALISRDGTEIDGILYKLIGRGRGLTPSGDDILLGLLVVDSGFKLLSEDFLGSLKGLVEEGGLTTDISTNYYLSGFEGDFGRNLRDFLSSLSEKNFEDTKASLGRIMDKGHSSGLDTITGIALGLEEILKRRKQ